MAKEGLRIKHPKIVVEQVYESCGIIGSGTYGIVYKVYRRAGSEHRQKGCIYREESDVIDPKKPYALKGMSLSHSESDGCSTASLRELSLLREIKHKNVIMLREAYIDRTSRHLWLLFDFAEFDLWYLFDKHRKARLYPNKQDVTVPMEESMIRSINWQMINGVHYLHENWIMHRDLKPGNIFITAPYLGGCVKIGDLGMARKFVSPLKPMSDVDPVVVTYWYRAPELLLGARHYTKAVDIWSIGCIIAELYLLTPLFHVKDDSPGKDPYNKSQIHSIIDQVGMPSTMTWPGMDKMPSYSRFVTDFRSYGNPQQPFARISHLPSTAQSFIRKFLHFNPESRLGLLAAMDDRYFKEPGIALYSNVFEATKMLYSPRDIRGKKRTLTSKAPEFPGQNVPDLDFEARKKDYEKQTRQQDREGGYWAVSQMPNPFEAKNRKRPSSSNVSQSKRAR